MEDEIIADGSWKPFLDKGYYKSVVMDGRTYDICLKPRAAEKRRFKGQWEGAIIETFRKSNNQPVAKAATLVSYDNKLVTLMSRLRSAFGLYNNAYIRKQSAGKVPERNQEV
jgi:hypothetical protein